MSTGLYVVLERDEEENDDPHSGRALAEASEALDQIAHHLNAVPLMEFFSCDPEEAVELMEDAGGDPSLVDFEEEKWYEPSAGLMTVRALRQYVMENPSSATHPEAICADLDALEASLMSAAEKGLRWHLAVDY